MVLGTLAARTLIETMSGQSHVRGKEGLVFKLTQTGSSETPRKLVENS